MWPRAWENPEYLTGQSVERHGNSCWGVSAAAREKHLVAFALDPNGQVYFTKTSL